MLVGIWSIFNIDYNLRVHWKDCCNGLRDHGKALISTFVWSIRTLYSHGISDWGQLTMKGFLRFWKSLCAWSSTWQIAWHPLDSENAKLSKKWGERQTFDLISAKALVVSSPKW